MVAFNNPDHLDPRGKGLWRDPELPRELLHFSTVILFLRAGVKPAVLPPTVANVHTLVEKSDGLSGAGLVQHVETKAAMQSLSGLPSHSTGFRVTWLVHDQFCPLPLPHILPPNIPVNSVCPFFQC